MKTQKLAFLTILMVFGVSSLSAQDYVFKVLANKGTNELKAGDAWEPLKIGATLKDGDEVRLGSNAYVGLVHNSGKPLEVKAARVYKVSDLESQVGGSTSVLQKYTDFILSSEEGPRNRLTATGAVHRGDPSEEESAIRLLLPGQDFSGMFNQTAIVRWETSGVEGPYIVTVRNMFEDVVSQEETPDKRYVLSLDDERYANEAALFVEVSAKADKKVVSTSRLIKRIPPADAERIAAELKALGDVATEESAMNHYVLAQFYEQNTLLVDAIYAYEQAVRMEPGVQFFQDEYEAFLTRNALK